MSGLKDQWSRPEEKKLSASAVPKTSEITLLQDDRHPMVRVYTDTHIHTTSLALSDSQVCSLSQVMPEMSLQTMMQGVDPMTIVQYLGIIEQRASEIVQAFQQWQRTSYCLLSSLGGVFSSVSHTPQPQPQPRSSAQR